MSVGVSRRALLAGGASLAGIGAMGALMPRVASAVLSPVRNPAFRRSTYVPLVGQTFQIMHDQGSLNVVLQQVSDLSPTLRPGAETQFSLMFIDAGLRPALPQETYFISQARLGQVSLFLVPVDHRNTVQRYQAIINSRP